MTQPATWPLPEARVHARREDCATTGHADDAVTICGYADHEPTLIACPRCWQRWTLTPASAPSMPPGPDYTITDVAAVTALLECAQHRHQLGGQIRGLFTQTDPVTVGCPNCGTTWTMTAIDEEPAA